MKLLLNTAVLAILLSCFIFYLYNNSGLEVKEDIGLLSVEEQATLERHGVAKNEFRLVSYPANTSAAQISRTESDNGLNGESFRLLFEEGKSRSYLGIHYHLTLLFRPYIKDGYLEFWLRGKEEYAKIGHLHMYLIDASISQNVVMASIPIRLDQEWHKVSLPLADFFSTSELKKNTRTNNAEFSWEVQEVIFSIDPSEIEGTVQLFVNGLKMLSGNRVIYEVL